MAETATRLPIKTPDKTGEISAAAPAREWHPIESLRKEVDRLFDDFDRSLFRSPFLRSVFDVEPFWRREFSIAPIPSADIVEHDKTYEISLDIPGVDPGNVRVELAEGILSVSGEKQEQKEEHKKNYHLSERYHGRFERSFRIPEDVDSAKITASFNKGVLTLSLPKDGEAKKHSKQIPVKAG